MTFRWIVGGCVAIAVGLGFVFPQVEAIRVNGGLTPGGASLLVLGLAGVMIGIGGVGHGIRRALSS